MPSNITTMGFLGPSQSSATVAGSILDRFPNVVCKRVQEVGIDDEQFQHKLKAAYQETVGGQVAPDFEVLVDVGNDEHGDNRITVVFMLVSVEVGR